MIQVFKGSYPFSGTYVLDCCRMFEFCCTSAESREKLIFLIPGKPSLTFQCVFIASDYVITI